MFLGLRKLRGITHEGGCFSSPGAVFAVSKNDCLSKSWVLKPPKWGHRHWPYWYSQKPFSLAAMNVEEHKCGRRTFPAPKGQDC